MTPDRARRFIAAVAFSALALLPVVSLCCLLTCITAAHDAASTTTSHCDTSSDESGTSRLVSGVACFSDVAIVPADLARPQHVAALDAVPAVAPAFLASPDPQVASGRSSATSRLCSRGSPLPLVLRI